MVKEQVNECYKILGNIRIHEEEVERHSWHLAVKTQSQERMDAVRASFIYIIPGGILLVFFLQIEGPWANDPPPLADARFFV